MYNSSLLIPIYRLELTELLRQCQTKTAFLSPFSVSWLECSPSHSGLTYNQGRRQNNHEPTMINVSCIVTTQPPLWVHHAGNDIYAIYIYISFPRVDFRTRVHCFDQKRNFSEPLPYYTIIYKSCVHIISKTN